MSLDPGGSAEFIITERSTRRVDSDTDGKKNEIFLFGKSVKGRDKVVGNCVFIFRLMILGFAGGNWVIGFVVWRVGEGCMGWRK